MTHLRKLVGNPRDLLARLRVLPAEPLLLHEAVTAIGSEATGESALESIGQIQSRVTAAIAAGELRKLSRRHLREGCRTFFMPPTPLSYTPEIRDAVINEVESLQRRAALFALLDSYIDAFAVADLQIEATARRLVDLTAAWPWRRDDDWPTRIDELALFDVEVAPRRIAHLMLEGREQPHRLLERLGLGSTGRRKGGLTEAAFLKACELVSGMDTATALKAQRRLIDWAQSDDRSFGYPRAWANFVAACLLPWRDTAPDDHHKGALIEVLERFGGGDPRIAPSRWRSVMDRFPDAYSVLLRWLTQASVLQFLDIVDRSLRDTDAKRMWSYRRAFWTSYLLGTGGGPQIGAAWVAFGDDGARLARQAARESGDPSFGVFGRQSDKSSQHAALIVEIGGLLIVDWSPSAKYNVWRAGDQGRPPLFKTSYPPGELYSAPLKESHSAPASYNWQKRLARIIEGRTFWSEKAEWRPKRV